MFGLKGSLSGSFVNCKYLWSIVIPNGVITLSQTFNNCDRLSNVELPSTLTTITSYAFRNNYALHNITLPNSLTTIGTQAFQGSRLVSVTIPSSVTSIESYAFDNISSLTEIICLGTVPPSISSTRPFGQTNQTFPIYVPDDSVAAYKSKDGFSQYANRIKGISERPTQ